MRKNYGLVTSMDELRDLLDRVGSDVCGFDIETGYHGPPREKFALHPETAFIAGFSLTNADTWARYVPLAHDQGDNLDPQEVAEVIWPWLNEGQIVPFNASFELRHCARMFRERLSDHPDYGDAVRESKGYFPIRSDALAEVYALAEQRSYGLKDSTQIAFGHQQTELYELFPDLPKKQRKTLRFNTLDLSPKNVDYACEDSLWTLRLHEQNYPRVRGNFIYDLEMATIQVVCEMEDFGIAYDWDLIRRAAVDVKEFKELFLPEIQQELSDLVGEPIHVNLNSPNQLREVLYGRLGMRVSRYTASTRKKPMAERVMSTDATALGTLAAEHPVVKRIVQYKELTTLSTRYLAKYLKEYNFAEDGMAHPSHLQCSVISGRFAVTDPPYNQTPGLYHYELASGAVFHLNYRDVITSPPDHYLLGFDIKQAELRGIAGLAQEPALMKTFADGVDPHRATAAMILNKLPDQVTAEERDKFGKTINFSVVYGLGEEALAEKLKVSLEEAAEKRNKLLSGYRAIARWSAEQIEFGKTHGYVLSHFGRRIPIWEFDASERWIRNKGERLCVNGPVQASATGDYGKICMVRSRAALKKAGMLDRVHMVMNVHDALYLYVHQSLAPQEVIEVLQPAVVFPVAGWPPMEVDWSVGRRWGSMRKLVQSDDGVWRIKESAPESDLPDEPLPIDDPDDEEVDDIPKPLPISPSIVSKPLDVESPAPSVLAVRVTTMPDQDHYHRFLTLARSRPGTTAIELCTPEGDVLLDQLRTGLTPQDQPQISLALAGAEVRYRTDTPLQMEGVRL